MKDPMLFPLVILIFIVFYYTFIRVSEKVLQRLILQHYHIPDQPAVALIFRKPTMNERIRYRIYGHLINAFFFYRLTASRGTQYFRVLEITESSDKETITYIEFYVSGNEIVEISELDKYEI